MLFPREHGAYGQLLFPLVCALLIGHRAAGAYLLAAAALAAFLAHESLLVVLGQRGSRAARERSQEAWRSLALFGGFGVICGGVALFVLPRASLVALASSLILAIVVGAFVAAGRERSTAGEMLVGITLASLSVPVAFAGLVAIPAALTLCVVFMSVFVTATVAVRAMIGRVARAGGPPPVVAGVLSVGVLVVLAGFAMRDALTRVAPLAALPVCAVGFWLTVWPPSPKRLRAIGWTLVGATALTATILVVALA
jgi:hypothetical protein